MEEKKESWIETLIELLNEYDKDRTYYKEYKYIMYRDDEWIDVDDKRTDLEIISKSYGFIKWLVDNDKIDFGNLKLEEITSWTDLYYSFKNYEVLLMLLSIQDEPIQFLISILK